MTNLSTPGTILSIWIHNNVHLGLDLLQLQIDLPNFIKSSGKNHFVSSLTTSETHFSLGHFLKPCTTIQNRKNDRPHTPAVPVNTIAIMLSFTVRHWKGTNWGKHCRFTWYCVRLFLLTTLHCLFVQTPLMHFHPKEDYDNELLVLFYVCELN